MAHFYLLLLALAPGIALMLYILHMDRREPEPLGFLLKITFLGALSFVPAVIIELALGKLPLFSLPGFTGALLVSFLQVAPAEELCKLGVVLLFVWKSRHFSEENDGIVYVGVSALGFAMLENIFYVLDQGFSTGIARAVTALPLHSFTGVIMGYYTGLGKFSQDKRTARRLVLRGFLYAYLFHAAYDSFALSGTTAAVLIVPLVIALVIFGVAFLRRGRRLSIQRWSEAAAEVVSPAVTAPAEEPVYHGGGQTGRSQEKPKWKAVASRTLLGVSALFWLLVLSAYFDENNAGKYNLGELIAGSMVLTFLPVLAGIILELSYQRGKRNAGVLKE